MAKKKSKSKKKTKSKQSSGGPSTNSSAAAADQKVQGDRDSQDMQFDSSKPMEDTHSGSDSEADARIDVVEEDDDGMVIDIEVDEDDYDGEDDVGGDDDDNVQDMEEDAVSDDEGNNNESGSNSVPPIPFMDTFYSLSSDSSSERTVAAHCLIRHCFPSSPSSSSTTTASSIQAKDAAYALRRLMAGLCSGRAGARQGFASALASFLKVAFAASVEDEEGSGERVLAIQLIQKQSAGGSDENEEETPEGGDSDVGGDAGALSPAEFVRKLLISETTPSQPTKRGAEERDYVFGRLFGIMAVVRSGTLSRQDVPLEVVRGYASNLVSLFQHKKWMREPSAHGIMELLSSLHDLPSPGEKTNCFFAVAEEIVSGILRSPKGNMAWSTIAPCLNAEQIGMCLHIQTLASASGSASELPEPLNTPLLTPENITVVSTTLRDTSAVVSPRCHLVWNAIWLYLTENVAEGEKKQGKTEKENTFLSPKQALRRSLPVGSTSGEDVIKAIVDEVIVKSLLGIGCGGNTTHERRTLALSLVQALCGASRPRIGLSPSLIENVVLQSSIVERLFVDVVQTASGGRSSRAEHTLKPRTLHVLNSVVDAIVSDRADEDNMKTRLALAKSFARAEPRFHAISKTDTIVSLLVVDSKGATAGILNDYVVFLERLICASAPHKAVGYVNAMLTIGKKAVRSDNDDAEGINIAESILCFLLVGAFFDLSGLSEPKTKDKKSKKRQKGRPVSIVAQRIITESNGAFPYQLRAAMSSCFFSYLADVVSIVPTSLSSSGEGSTTTKSKRAVAAHDLINFVVCACDELEEKGAALYSDSSDITASYNEDDEDVPTPPKDALQAMENMLQITSKHDEAVSNAVIACSSLLSALYLQLLSSGKPDGVSDDEEMMNEDPDDTEEMNDEIKEMISDVIDIAKSLFLVVTDNDEARGGGENAEGKETPLAGFAELCINILSSSVGGDVGKNTTRGGAAKLIRDCVKNAWSLVLPYAHYDKGIHVDQDIMAVLVESVCGSSAMLDEMEDEEEDDEEEDTGMGSGGEESDNDGVFMAANVADLNLNASDDENSIENDNLGYEDESDDEDVELDQEQVSNLLLEDSDTEGGADVLEHHAGADKALAKLIKMKQEARKAGKLALERIEIASRMRCVVLLELALSSNAPLEDGAVLLAILPLLRARRSLEKVVLSSLSLSGGKKATGLSEKRALMDRISSLLQKRVCKSRLNGISSLAGEELRAARDARAELAARVMAEAKKSLSQSHSDCCSLSLILIMKSLPQDEGNAIAIAKSVYCDAIKQWSSSKSSKLKTSILHDLIVRSPSLARVVLAEPLTDAAENARSAFLKAESFRLLSDLYHVARTDDSQLVDTGMASLQRSAGKFASSLSSAAQDSDIAKAKRARELLKAATELVAFSSAHCQNDADLWDQLEHFAGLLKDFGDGSNSPAINTKCKSIVEMVAEGSKARLGETSGKAAKKSSAGGSKKKKKKGKR